MPFSDRADAGRALAGALAGYRNQAPVILALPRGGVPVAAEVASAFNAPLDLVLVRKLGVPFQPELAMGAVAEGDSPLIIRNEDVIALAEISEPEFQEVCRREVAEIDRRRRAYLGDRPRVAVAGRVAIVIDDGIATGATTRAALRATRAREPRALVLAVPVAPTDTLLALRDEVDDLICVESYPDFGAIGFYYRDFRQVSDGEVKQILDRLGISAPARQMKPDG